MSKPAHVSALIAGYLSDLHSKQTDGKNKRRVEALIEAAAGYSELPNVQTIKRGRRA